MSRLPSILFPGQEADAVIDDYYLPLNVANKEPDNGFDLEDNRNVKKERVEEDQLTWGQIVGNAGMKQGYYDAFLNYLTLWKYPEGYGEKSRKALRHVARLYCVKDGKLFKKATKEDERDRQVVPTKQVVQILRECHDHVLSVHQGIKATYQRVKQRYYWPGYYDTVREYVQSCKVCQGFDIANAKIPLHTVEDRVDGAFAKIGIDYIYTPKTSQGRSDALVIIDYLTAWVHVEPVSTQSASSTCLGLFKWICQYGCLSQIIADNGLLYAKPTLTSMCLKTTCTSGSTHTNTWTHSVCLDKLHSFSL